MLAQGATLVERDLGREPLGEDELRLLIGARDPRDFLNTRNELYRSRGMAKDPPTPAEAIRLMAANPNLIRRPIATRGGARVLGFDAEALARLVRRTG